MNYKEFEHLAKEYKTVPVYKRILADLLTPISAYMRLAKKSDYSFILESAEQGEGYGRYSFIGRNPHIILKSEKNIPLPGRDLPRFFPIFRSSI
mgnify:CR=1 FL=1